MKLPANDGNGYWRLHCQTPEGIAPTGFKFRLSDLPNTIEAGTNNTPQTATAGAAPGAFNGVVAKPGEVDYFKFAAKKGQVFDVRCHARALGSPLDPVMVSACSGRSLVGGTTTAAGRTVTSLHRAGRQGIRDLGSRSSEQGRRGYFYRIEVTPVQPRIETTIPRVDGNNPANQDRQTITVPKGNRHAVLLIANRADFGGPLVVGLEKLPPGVTLAAEQMDPGLNVIPVVFEAKPDAATGGFLTTITATHADPNVKVPAKTAFDAVFSVGQNNVPYMRHYIDRTAIAVG